MKECQQVRVRNELAVLYIIYGTLERSKVGVADPRNVDVMSLDGHVSLFLILRIRFSGDTGRQTASSLWSTVVVVASFCAALNWMIPLNVLNAAVYRKKIYCDICAYKV